MAAASRGSRGRSGARRGTRQAAARRGAATRRRRATNRALNAPSRFN